LLGPGLFNPCVNIDDYGKESKYRLEVTCKRARIIIEDYSSQ